MKKHFIVAAFAVFIPLTTFASFDANLKYGMQGGDVYQLQDVLQAQGCLLHPSTGYFGLLTLDAVKCFQLGHGVPSTGYVGSMTRTELNSIVTAVIQPALDAEVSETGVALSDIHVTPVTNNSYIPMITDSGVTLATKEVVCTDKNPLVPGKKVIQFAIDTDWTKVKIVLVKYPWTDGGITYTNAPNSIYKPFVNINQLSDGKFGLEMKAYASEDMNEASLLATFKGSITAPQCE